MAKTSRHNPNAEEAPAKAVIKKSSKPKVRAKRWTKEELECLHELVCNGEPRGGWNNVSYHLPGRTAKQCREKYHSQQPVSGGKRKSGFWSEEENQSLIALQAIHGNKWRDIAAAIEGRTENDVKNRWYSMQRQEHKRAVSSATGKCGKRKAPSRKLSRTTRERNVNNENDRSGVASMNEWSFLDEDNAELVDSGDLFEMPRLSDVASDPATALNSVAESLLDLKTGLTPLKKDDLGDDAQSPCFKIEPHQILPPKKSYKLRHLDNQENIAPVAFNSSHFDSFQRPFPSIGPERKFSYPPPPPIKYSVRGSPTPVIQAQCSPSSPRVPSVYQNIKASDIFSPSYVQASMTTPSSGIPLDSVPLCDSIPLKSTPMKPIQSTFIYGQTITMSNIKPTPLPNKKKRPSVGALTPLCFVKTPDMSYNGAFFETAGILLDSTEDLNIKLPPYSPMTTGVQSTPPGAWTAV